MGNELTCDVCGHGEPPADLQVINLPRPNLDPARVLCTLCLRAALLKAEAELEVARVSNIAERLGGEVRGKVRATGGYFGALALAEEIERRFKSPKGGGRATDPEWTEQRLIRLKAGTRERLERFAKHLSAQGQHIAPMQLAALLLEKASEDFKQSIDEEERQ